MRNATMVRSSMVAIALACATLAAGGSGCNRAKSAKAPQGPTVLPVPEALDINKLPSFVDRDLFRAMNKVVQQCKVDTSRSEVTCPDEYFDNIATLYRKQNIPRHEAMQTASYLFEHGTLELKTVAAELLFRGLRGPSGTTPDKPVAQKLIKQLATLPWAQAADAAPAITVLALRMKLDDEIYAALDGAHDKRITAAGYRYAMSEGRMAVFPRIFQLAGDQNLELAVAAVEAVREMGGRTVEENVKLCDWMQELVKGGRPLIETRAAAYLATCGTKYVEGLLTLDEKRQAAKQPLSGGMGIYVNLCRRGEKHAFGAPTASQCGRLKKLATDVLTDTSTREADRVQALAILTDQFPDKDTLALAGKLATDTQTTVLARRAQDALKDLAGPERRDRVE